MTAFNHLIPNLHALKKGNYWYRVGKGRGGGGGGEGEGNLSNINSLPA